jgi:hypothetical protein
MAYRHKFLVGPLLAQGSNRNSCLYCIKTKIWTWMKNRQIADTWWNFNTAVNHINKLDNIDLFQYVKTYYVTLRCSRLPDFLGYKVRTSEQLNFITGYLCLLLTFTHFTSSRTIANSPTLLLITVLNCWLLGQRHVLTRLKIIELYCLNFKGTELILKVFYAIYAHEFML